MPTKKRGSNLTKSSRKKKPINIDHLVNIKPITQTQTEVFEEWKLGKNLVLHGVAGTGKTFIAMYLALKEVLNTNSTCDKIYIVRSLVPTREIGFLPGDQSEKAAIYEMPYRNMVRYIFDLPEEAAFEHLYENLKAQDTIQFLSTSYLRGLTIDNSIIIVDEFSNMNFHELDSIITRLGNDSRIIFCGDIKQSDLVKQNERNGVLDFMGILDKMREFATFEFTLDDIVRSGLVRAYLISKYHRGF